MFAIARTTIPSGRFPKTGTIVCAMRVSESRRFTEQIEEWKRQNLEVETVPYEWLEGKMGTAERYEPGDKETANESDCIENIIQGESNYGHA